MTLLMPGSFCRTGVKHMKVGLGFDVHRLEKGEKLVKAVLVIVVITMALYLFYKSF